MNTKKPTSKKNESPYKKYMIVIMGLVAVFTILIVIYSFLGITNFANIVINWNSVSSGLAVFKDLLFNLILATLASFFLIVMLVLVVWIGLNEGYVIQPFEVCGCEKDFSGVAISQLLIKELLRIRKIHRDYREYMENGSKNNLLKPKDFPAPTIQGGSKISSRLPVPDPLEINTVTYDAIPGGQEIDYNITNLGTAGQGSINISIGHLLLVLKRLIKGSKVIIGSLQRYGSGIALVAWMGHKTPMSWESSGEIGYITKDIGHIKKEEATAINESVRNLAYMISKDIMYIEKERIRLTNISKVYDFIKSIYGYYYIKLIKNLSFISRYNKQLENKRINNENNSEKDIVRTWKGHKYFTEAIYNYYMYKTTNLVKYLDDSGNCSIQSIKAERVYSEPVKLLYLIGAEYLNLDNEESFKKAEKLFIEAINLRSHNYFFLGLGTTLIYQEKYHSALECYNKALEIDPTYAEAWNNKGSIYYNQKEYASALKCYNKALDMNINFAEAWNNRGRVYAHNNHEEAFQCYNNALEIDPTYAEAWKNKGNIFYYQKNYKKAIEYYNKSIEIDSHYALPWNNKGASFHHLGEPDEALNCYNKALKIDQINIYAWNNIGEVLLVQNDYRNAMEYFEKALEINPNYATAHNNKGNVFYKCGKYDNALKYYDNALKIDPNDIRAWKGKENVHTKLNEVIQHADSVIELNPVDVIAWRDRGDALKSLGRENTSEIAYSIVFGLDPYKNLDLILNGLIDIN